MLQNPRRAYHCNAQLAQFLGAHLLYAFGGDRTIGKGWAGIPGRGQGLRGDERIRAAQIGREIGKFW